MRDALTRIGVHGMDRDRGQRLRPPEGPHGGLIAAPEYAVNFLPKLRVEVAVASEQIDQIVDAISAAARTGQIGDGKVFVMPLEQALRIRTGETSVDAL